jgi:uncharacterized protein YndB with AHSA1/START domain
MADIMHQITVKAPTTKIYELIVTKTGIRQWLSKEDSWKVTGEEKPRGILFFISEEITMK